MDRDDVKKFYKTLLDEFGKESVLYIAIEEMAELQKELVKHLRGRKNVNHIAEEVADVEIMMDQLKQLLDIDEETISEFKSIKIARTVEMMEGKGINVQADFD